MKKIAIIGSTNIFNLPFIEKRKIKEIKTPYGKTFIFPFGNLFILNRHGKEGKIPPHKINHLANIFACRKLKISWIFAFNSVGSLRKNILPQSFFIPIDFIDFDPITFYEKEAKFIIPSLSFKLRKILKKILKKLKYPFKEGIYFQTKGPRLETKAEINLIKRFAHVVGMTMAKEATLAKEIDLEYISLCLIANFAHGLLKKPLTMKEIKENERKFLKKIEKIILEISKIK